jgi:hypothetical protein
MPEKIQFEWALPDTLVDALTHDWTEVADTMKAAAVLDWVRTHKLSLRRGAEMLQMPYRAFLGLMAAHRVPSMSRDGWTVNSVSSKGIGERHPHDPGRLR